MSNDLTKTKQLKKKDIFLETRNQANLKGSNTSVNNANKQVSF